MINILQWACGNVAAFQTVHDSSVSLQQPSSVFVEILQILYENMYIICLFASPFIIIIIATMLFLGIKWYVKSHINKASVAYTTISIVEYIWLFLALKGLTKRK